MFFKKDDVLRFDFTSIGRGIVEVYYSEFNKVYRDEIYVWLTQDIEDFEKQNGVMLSPVPKFILNEEMTDIENRVFEWTFESDDLGIDLGATKEGREKVTGVKDKSLPTEAEAKAQKEEDKAREKQVKAKLQRTADVILVLTSEQTPAQKSSCAPTSSVISRKWLYGQKTL